MNITVTVGNGTDFDFLSFYSEMENRVRRRAANGMKDVANFAKAAVQVAR